MEVGTLAGTLRGNMTEMEFLSNLVFITDSREQCPYQFTGRKTESAALSVGDYSIKGLEGEISIERKSDDLIQSICQDRERFERELERSRSLKYFALVVETSLTELTMGRYRSRMTPQSAIQTLLTFSVRYGIPVFFAESRESEKKLLSEILMSSSRRIRRVRDNG